MKIFDRLHYFDAREAWGRPDMMSGFLLLLFDSLRDIINVPIVIHCGYSTSGHSSKSYHYSGNAVDFSVRGLPFLDAYKAINQALEDLQVSGRVGLGVYPFWNTPGFHLDDRGVKARWGALKNGQYVGIEAALQHLNGAL